MILLTVAIMIAPASAYFSGQNVETKAEKMVEIAENALERVNEVVETTEANTTIMDLIIAAELDDEFYGNFSLCVKAETIVNGTSVTVNGTGWEALNASKEALLVAVDPAEYETVIEQAQEASEIFRDVLKAINEILIDVGVQPYPTCDAEGIEEAIERSEERVATLQDLLADEELLAILEQAQGNLTEARNALPDVELAREFLQDANQLISDVCKDLKTVAQNMNPGRIRSYIARAFKNNERVQEKFRNKLGNQEDINQFLQGLGYNDEEEFWNRFDLLIESAEDANTVKEAAKALQDLGKMMKNTDNSLNQLGNNSNNQGANKGNGIGNMGNGNSP